MKKILKCPPFGRRYQDFEKNLNSQFSENSASAELKLSDVPPTASENYVYLKNMLQKECRFSKIFRSDTTTKTVTQKMVAFNFFERIDMVNIGCILPNLSKNRLCKSKNLPSQRTTKTCWTKLMTKWLLNLERCSLVKPLVMIFFSAFSSTICKWIVGIYASQQSTILYESANV